MAGTSFSAGKELSVGTGRPSQGRQDAVADRARQQSLGDLRRQARAEPGGGSEITRARAQARAEAQGHPQFQQPPEEQQPVGDYRHVQLMAQYYNMQDLGREQPFGIWALNSGEYGQLLPQGQVPFDIFEES